MRLPSLKWFLKATLNIIGWALLRCVPTLCIAIYSPAVLYIRTGVSKRAHKNLCWNPCRVAARSMRIMRAWGSIPAG